MKKFIAFVIIGIALLTRFGGQLVNNVGDLTERLNERGALVVPTPLPTPTPTPTPTPAPVLVQYQASYSALWWYVFWSALLVLLIAGGFALLNRFLIVPARLRWADEKTGLHPVEVKPGASWLHRIGATVGLAAPVDEVVSDYNKNHAPTYVVRRDRSALNVQTSTHGLNDQDQLQFARDHVKVRNTVAQSRAFPGRGGPSKNQFLDDAGYFDQLVEERRAKAEQARLKLAQMQEAQSPPAEEPAPQVELLTLKQAVERSTPQEWIIGQNQASGKVAIFAPNRAQHLAILGATGTGKTKSTGMLIVGYALRFGYRVRILDGKGGEDWSVFARWCEHEPTDSGNFVALLRPIFAEFERRSALLREHKASSYRRLPEKLQPWFILIEEYGDLNERMKKADHDAANLMLTTMVRLARSTGIHLCFIDQYPEKWDDQLMQNTKLKVCYWLLDGAKVKEYNIHELREQGQFMIKGEKYDAWLTRKQLKGFMADVPALRVVERPTPVPVNVQQLPAAPTGEKTDVQSFSERSEGGEVQAESSALPPPPPVNSERAERLNAATELERIVWGWREEHPNGSQAELRDWLKGKQIKVSRGHVHGCWHKYPGPAPTSSDAAAPTDDHRSALERLQAQYGKDAKLYFKDEPLGKDITERAEL